MIQKLVDYIIHPQRQKYSATDLGPEVFMIDGMFRCERMDFEVKNQKGFQLKCSLYNRCIDKERQYPVVIYCHGSSGNRVEADDAVNCLLRYNVLVVCFDFAGCGLSDGSSISLGHYEKDDVAVIYEYIRKTFKFVDQDRIGLWGRSMGAVAALLFAASHTQICFLILDSPFADLSLLLKGYMNRFKLISKLAGKYVYKNLKAKILEQGGFDFEEVSPIASIEKCSASILFVHGTADTIVPIEHSSMLYKAYPGEKNLLEIEAGHNDPRLEATLKKIGQFVIDVFSNWKPNSEGAPKRKSTIKAGFFSRDLETLDCKKIETCLKITEADKPSTYGDEDEVGEGQEMEENMIVQSRPFTRSTARHKMYIDLASSQDNPEQERNMVTTLSELVDCRASVNLPETVAMLPNFRNSVRIKMQNNTTLTVSKYDAKQVETMLNIFEELNTDNIEDEEKTPKFQVDVKRNSNYFGDYHSQGDENFPAEDLADSPMLGSNFEMLRQTKTLTKPALPSGKRIP